MSRPSDAKSRWFESAPKLVPIPGSISDCRRIVFSFCATRSRIGIRARVTIQQPANSSQAMSLDGSGVGFSDCSAGSPSNKVGLRKNSTSGNKCTRPALRFCTQLRTPTHRVSIRSRPVTLTRSATCGRSPLSQRNTLTAYSGWGWFRVRMIPDEDDSGWGWFRMRMIPAPVHYYGKCCLWCCSALITLPTSRCIRLKSSKWIKVQQLH